MTHWRKPHCEGRHVASLFYCTYPNCNCEFQPDGDLRDTSDSVPVHSHVLGDRSGRGIQDDAPGDNVVPMSRGRRSPDGEPAVHGSWSSNDVLMRAEADEPFNTDRHLRVVGRELDAWKVVAALIVVGFWVAVVYLVMKAAGA